MLGIIRAWFSVDDRLWNAWHSLSQNGEGHVYTRKFRNMWCTVVSSGGSVSIISDRFFRRRSPVSTRLENQQRPKWDRSTLYVHPVQVAVNAWEDFCNGHKQSLQWESAHDRCTCTATPQRLSSKSQLFACFAESVLERTVKHWNWEVSGKNDASGLKYCELRAPRARCVRPCQWALGGPRTLGSKRRSVARQRRKMNKQCKLVFLFAQVDFSQTPHLWRTRPQSPSLGNGLAIITARQSEPCASDARTTGRCGQWVGYEVRVHHVKDGSRLRWHWSKRIPKLCERRLLVALRNGISVREGEFGLVSGFVEHGVALVHPGTKLVRFPRSKHQPKQTPSNNQLRANIHDHDDDGANNGNTKDDDDTLLIFSQFVDRWSSATAKQPQHIHQQAMPSRALKTHAIASEPQPFFSNTDADPLHSKWHEVWAGAT